MTEGIRIDLYKIEIDLEQEPENAAEQIYEKLTELPFEVRKNLDIIIKEFTLTQPVKLSKIKNYTTNHSHYNDEVASMDDSGD